MDTRAWVATRKGLFELRRDSAGSAAWCIARVSFLGEPETMLLSDEQGHMLAALNLGHFGVHLHRIEDAGDPNIQDPHRIVRCAAAPQVLWCQHHCGTWRSTDNATSWQEVKAPVSSFGFAVAVHPQDPDTAWFVPAIKDEKRVPVDGALVVNRTRDGGKSFETLRTGLPQQHAYDLVYRHGLDVSADGQSLLMGSTTGGLWASGDAGECWQAVSLNLPPIAAVRFG